MTIRREANIFSVCSDLVEILHHFPGNALKVNRDRIVKMTRDIGAAYVAELRSAPEGDTQDQSLARLLHHLEMLEQGSFGDTDLRRGGGGRLE
jgi:hypothetical protein